MDEPSIDRRAHWLQMAVTGIVVATIWCVKLQMNLAQLEQDFKDYKKEQKLTIKELDNRLDEVSDRTNGNAKDVEWILKGGRK